MTMNPRYPFGSIHRFEEDTLVCASQRLLKLRETANCILTALGFVTWRGYTRTAFLAHITGSGVDHELQNSLLELGCPNPATVTTLLRAVRDYQTDYWSSSNPAAHPPVLLNELSDLDTTLHALVEQLKHISPVVGADTVQDSLRGVGTVLRGSAYRSMIEHQLHSEGEITAERASYILQKALGDRDPERSQVLRDMFRNFMGL